MSKRNVLLFLPGRSWQAPVGRAGQGRAISPARALWGLPALSHLPPALGSQATEGGVLRLPQLPHKATSASGQTSPRLALLWGLGSGAGVPPDGPWERCGNSPK